MGVLDNCGFDTSADGLFGIAETNMEQLFRDWSLLVPTGGIGGYAGKASSSFLSRYISKLFNRSDGLTIQRQRLVNLIHQRELGLDPAKGKFSTIEAAVGTRLEKLLNMRLSRETTRNFDWVNRAGKTFDAVGPAPVKYFNYGSFTNSINSHLLKQGLNHVVVDMTGMGKGQISQVSKYISSLPNASQARIIKVGF